MIPEGWQICTVCGLMYEVGCECPGVALGEHTIDARSLFVSPAYAAEVERPDEGVVRCAKCARWHSGVNNADVKTNLCEDCAPSSERAVSEEPHVCGDPDCICTLYAPLGLRSHRPSFRASSALPPASPLSEEDAKFVAGVQAGIDAGAYTARGVIIGLLAVIRRLVPSPGIKGSDNG